LAQFSSDTTNPNFSNPQISAPLPPSTSLPQYTAAATSNSSNFVPTINPAINPNYYATPQNPYGNAIYGNYSTPNANLYVAGSGANIPPNYFAQIPQTTYSQYYGAVSPYSQPPYSPYSGYFGGQYNPYYPYNNPYYEQNPMDSENENQYHSHESENSPYSAENSGYGQYMPVRSPLLETGWRNLKLLSPFNAPDGPHRNVGCPLEGESWLDRPYYFGVFGGKVCGTKLVKGQIDQKSGSGGGVVLGWNIDHYWGVESRLFSSSVSIHDISNSVMPVRDRSNKVTTIDAAVHYYPYGEAKWRPYMKIGLGYIHERFQDNFGKSQKINTWGMPFGFGLKYWWSDRVSVYGEVVDNIIFGREMTTTHSQWAFDFGVNFSFGTNSREVPTLYWPQTPAR
jgi:hypothetical protein